MFFHNVVIPMRAQPFHKGHAHLIQTMARYSKNVAVALCRDYDCDRNPFPFYIRRLWIEVFLARHDIRNVFVPYRMNNISRYDEYRGFFNNGDNITVLVTPETEKFYRDLFSVYNHHEDCYGMWHMHPMLAGLRVADNGRIIRERLRNGLECDAYLHRDVTFLARMII